MDRTPNDILLLRIRALSRVHVQNCFMRLPDRQIGLAMMFMQDSDRLFILSFLSPPKAQNIKEELKLQGRLKITYDQYKKAIQATLDALSGNHRSDSLKTYIRPTQKRPRR